MGNAANKVFDPAATVQPAESESRVEASTSPAADDVPDRTDFPCSIAQERFWLLDRLDPGNSAYNVAVRWRLEGRVSTELLERAWLAIIDRHEVLRTVFLEIDGAPIQRVMPKVPFRVNEIDLSNLAPELQQTEGDRIGVIEARAPFDLASGPLIRATLLRYSPILSIILVTTHQVVSDGWSIGIMAREMGVLYDALRQSRPPELEPLAIQYADYSEWQLEWLRIRGTEAESAYWTRQLAGVRPFRVLPDRARPAMPTTNGAIVSRVLPRDLTNRAQALSAERGATLFATAFAALCATLARFTRETEIVVGTQVSGRDQVELEPMIGQFVNSLILRNDLGGNPTFGSIVDRVRDTIAQALEHRHIPIERLLGMVKAERSDANTPPISVNFIFQKTFIQNMVYGEFALIDMPSLPAGAIYDLNLFMVERPDGWRFSCQYNTDQFERATAERLLAYFEKLLASAVGNASQRLSDLPLAAPDEARLLLAKLNDTRALYPRELTLAQLFEAQVARVPDAVAVACGDRQFSYRQLNASANRVAAYLQSQGVAAGSRVGVCLRAALELSSCVLAILKVGATVVLLDPHDPPLRRADSIRASGTTAVIGHRLERAAVADVPVHLIEIETAIAHGAAAHAPAAQGADTCACIGFESGHDDASRLVELSHRTLANLVFSFAKRPGITDRDVVLCATAPASARALFEWLLPLLTGARLVLPLERELAGPPLLTLLQRSGATVMSATPEVWSALLDTQWVGYPALKMLCAATGLTPRLGERLCAVGGELWLLFGVPAAGIWSAVHRFKGKDELALLGTPVANTSLYVLEPSMRLAPVGVVGQLHVGGDGLTERALAASIVMDSGTRVYPTRWLARLLGNGQIERLGRMDDMVSLQGGEIDPLEIEQALRRHAAIEDAGVTLTRDAAGEPGLAAFVVCRAGAADDAATVPIRLHEFMVKCLPAHMVPQSIAVRDALPRLADGALDRRALSALKARPHRSAVPQRTGNELESRLAALWAPMLGVPSIAPGDNFFEMGGHSLLAARMLTQVEKEFGRRIKLASLFLAPTLHEFANLLAQTDLRDFDFRQVVKIQPHGSKRPLIVINNTGIYYGLAKNLGAEQPVYSLQLFDPSVRDSELPNSLEEIAKGYVELIRRVQPQGPYDLMGWCVAGALAFEIARQLVQSGQEVSHLFLIDSWVPGYFKRQTGLRGVLSVYSLRAQLIMADWRRVLDSEKSLWAFLTQRTLFKRLQRLLGGRQRAAAGGETTQATPETYDQWLLAYLQRVTNNYTPKAYDGRVTLLRSRLEPTGWFFREDAGWGDFASAGVAVRFVDGNHFTMFQDPGSTQMAAHVAAALSLRDQARDGGVQT